jgi:TatA/E family protein of Tat protein translocase
MEGLLSPTHLLFILAIVLIIFGPGKLPDLGRGLGKGIREFKDAMRGGFEAEKKANVRVWVSPAETTLTPGSAQQFNGNVSGTTNYELVWNVNGIQGGNTTLGQVTASGLYSAPAVVPASNPVTITAVSTADAAQSGSASVTLVPLPEQSGVMPS